MKKVYAVQDNDCHWYVIPFELKDEFFELESKINGENEIEAVEADEKFIELFSQYMTGGDLNNTQLYAEI